MGWRTPITKEGYGNIPTLVNFDTSRTLIINKATEEDLFTVTIPRNSLGLTDRAIKVTLEYNGYNNSGAARTITWRVYYGSSAALVLPVDTWAAAVTDRAGTFTVYLINTGSVSAQNVYARDESEKAILNLDSWTQDSGKALDLTITAQFSAASNNLFITNFCTTVTQFAP